MNMKVLNIIILVLLFSYSIGLASNHISNHNDNLPPKFHTPKEAPYNYYEEEFLAKDSFGVGRWQEIQTTKVEWLYVLKIKKFDDIDPSKYSDVITYLLDGRKGKTDGKARIITMTHERKAKVFFSMVDQVYLGPTFLLPDVTDWKIIKGRTIKFTDKTLIILVRALENRELKRLEKLKNFEI